MITQLDDNHLQIDLIDKRKDTLKRAINISDENQKFKYQKNGDIIEAVHYLYNYNFNLENDLSYDLYTTDDLSIDKPKLNKDKKPYIMEVER